MPPLPSVSGVGDYRVVYTLRDQQLVVLVIAAAHRREICRDL